MILKDRLYKIQSFEDNESRVVYEISLIPESEIYKAHFPNKPITPGVCIVQFVVELLNEYLKEGYKLSFAKNIKYLQVVSPIDNPNVSVELKKIMLVENHVTLQAVVSNNDQIFAKMTIQCEK